MQRLNLTVDSMRHPLMGVVVLGIAVLSGSAERDDRRVAAGTGRATDDPCVAGPRLAATGGAIADHGLLWRLYPAGVDRRRSHDGTPSRFHAALLGDVGAMASVDDRKAAFISVVLPMIDRVNQEILHHRRLVESATVCRGDGRSIGLGLQAALLRLHDRYRTDGDLAVLRQRLDIVPPSLAIAQAAIESGWGTSRFAVHGNALFGQRTTNPDRGMRPADLPATTAVRVAAFDHLMASVRSYVHNLNTYPAYRNFRAHRSAFRRNGEEPDGLMLAGTLIAYSSRGGAYVRDLKSIIRGNRLAAFDTATKTASPGGRSSRSDI